MSSGRGCSSRPFVLRDAHYVPPCWPPRAESLVSPRSDLTCRGPVRLCCRWYRPAVNGSTGKTCWFSRQILCFSWGFFVCFFFLAAGRSSFVFCHRPSQKSKQLCGQRERSDAGGRSRVRKTKLEKESSSKPEQFEFVCN